MKHKLAIFMLILALLAPSIAIHAQDTISGVDCASFGVNPDAPVFGEVATLEAAGFAPDDMRDLALAAKQNNIPFTRADISTFLAGRGYSADQISNLLDDDTNLTPLTNLLSPSPSNDILVRAYSLLSSYGLPSSDLTALYPLVSDEVALLDAILARGLSPEQAQTFATEGIALAIEAQNLGVFRYAATLDMADVLDAYLDEYNTLELADILDDEAALMAQFAEWGATDDEMEALLAEFGALEDIGISEELIESWGLNLAEYTSEFYGIDPELLQTFASSGDDMEAIGDCLEAMGLDEAWLGLALEDFDDYFGDDGLSFDELDDIAAYDLAELLYAYGLLPEDLADLYALAGDDDAIREWLAGLGYSDDDIEFFLLDFGNLASFDFVDDDDIDEFITEIGDDFAEFDDMGMDDEDMSDDQNSDDENSDDENSDG
jgi:hypothetical protein